MKHLITTTSMVLVLAGGWSMASAQTDAGNRKVPGAGETTGATNHLRSTPPAAVTTPFKPPLLEPGSLQTVTEISPRLQPAWAGRTNAGLAGAFSPAGVAADQTGAPVSDFRSTSFDSPLRSTKHELNPATIRYGGILPDLVESDQPLQLINPWAPVESEPEKADTWQDPKPDKEKIGGISLVFFRLKF